MAVGNEAADRQKFASARPYEPKAMPTSAAGRAGLERYVFFVVVAHVRTGRGLGTARCGLVVASAVAARGAAAFVAFAIEHLHRVGDDLGAVLLLARLLVVPAVGADGAFDI